jgi:asparagine synthetase B (glutamine-hydrolysing)
MVSDVPIGALLSGGVDSSAVVAMMARTGSGTIKTFSIGFSARQYDETNYARMVAQRYATEHREFVVEPDTVTVLPLLVWHYGEPFADPSAIPTYYVSEAARRKVTVALNGDGGDECFLVTPGTGRCTLFPGLTVCRNGAGRGSSACSLWRRARFNAGSRFRGFAVYCRLPKSNPASAMPLQSLPSPIATRTTAIAS